jgi:hypothetical protein
MAGDLPRPDAATDVAIIVTALDRDGDGIPDSTDNCPDTVNPDQANEDGDPFGDACDLCPQIAEMTQTDTDGDKIGNACDPNPTLKDTVWLYSGFRAGLPAWSRSVNWTGSGEMIQTISSGNTGDPGEYMITPFTPTAAAIDNFSITTTVKVTQEAGSNNEHSLGLEIWDITAKKGVDCALDHNPAGANAILYLQEVNNTGPTNNLNKMTSYGWAMNVVYRLTETRHGNTYTCMVVGPDGTQATLTGTSQVVPRDGTTAEIWAFGATAQYSSIQIIGAP